MAGFKNTIIVVEKDKDMLFLLEKALNDSGFDVNGLQSASTLMADRYEVPDIFLLDKEPPSMDVLTVCECLKQRDATRRVPIVLISAYPVKNKAKRSGVDEFLRKPFKLSLLLEAIDRQLALRYEANLMQN